jgi:hypothetical protein
MKFKEIASRLTGISCPVFGMSWTPPEPDISVARRLITYLEDRRVLYQPCEVEIPEHCVHSIIEIRKYLTQELSKSDLSAELSNNLRAMRGACRKFLTRVQCKDREIIPFANQHGHFASWIFMDAIGQLRGVFGVHLAQLAVRHGLDIEDDLAEIIPGIDNDEDVEHGAANRRR